jgi:hypothetical protein
MSADDDMTQQPEWDDVTAMWQSGGPNLDIAKLFKHARLNWWKIRLSVVGNILASLMGIIACAYVIIEQASPFVIVFGVSGIIFCATSGRFTYQYYKGSSGHLTKDAQALLKLQIRQLRSIISFARFNFWGCFAAFLFGLMGFGVIYQRKGELLSDNRGLYYLIGLTAVTLIIYPLYYRNVISRKTRELDELISNLGSLEDVED